MAREEGVKTGFVGIDVSKAWLDVHCRPEGREQRFANDADGIASLLEMLGSMSVERVVLEATGGYEREALLALFTADMRVFLVQPNSARHFAKSKKQYAKTDRLDAQVLAHMAECLDEDEQPWRPAGVGHQELRELVQRRSQLNEMLDSENKRKRAASKGVAKDTFDPIISALKQQLTEVMRRIDELMANHVDLKQKAEILEGVDGVGRVTAAAVLAELPEIGTLSRTEIASLVGVAPLNRDSGERRGKAFTYGGREAARKALYMAALAATRHNEVIQTYYARLVKRGKAPKVALIACVRKLVIHLNALLKNIGKTAVTPTNAACNQS